MTSYKKTNFFLITILCLIPVALIFKFIDYTNNAYPLFSFENASISIMVVGFLIVAFILIQVRKKDRKQSSK